MMNSNPIANELFLDVSQRQSLLIRSQMAQGKNVVAVATHKSCLEQQVRQKGPLTMHTYTYIRLSEKLQCLKQLLGLHNGLLQEMEHL